MLNTEKFVEVKGKIIGDPNQPVICTPLTSSNPEALLLELENVVNKQPDIIEWRADFFNSLADTDCVLEITRKMRAIAGDIPFLFTIRSIVEGGQPISITNQEKMDLYSALCESKSVDIIDFELFNSDEEINELRRMTKKNGIKLILSYHNFETTPGKEVLYEKVTRAEKMAADISKIAVMPGGLEDVLELLSLTLQAKNHSKIPLISISMGNFGALTRMFGWVFGSVFTFGIGENSSAPGQIPIKDLRTIIEIAQKSIGNV